MFIKFLNLKRNIIFSKTHVINKKTAWLLNLRGVTINGIFHSSLYLFFFFSSAFNYSLVYLSLVCHKHIRTWGLCDVCLTFMFYECKFWKYLVFVFISLFFCVIDLFEAEMCISALFYLTYILHPNPIIIKTFKWAGVHYNI